MNKRYALFSAIIIAIAGFAWYALSPAVPAVPESATPTTTVATTTPSDTIPAGAAAPSTTPTGATVTLVVEGRRYETHSSDGSTVLEVMQQLKNGGLEFTAAEYPGMGYFVSSINGKKNDGGYYWFLYVNDVSSSAGASGTRIHSGDIIEWKYKQSY